MHDWGKGGRRSKLAAVQSPGTRRHAKLENTGRIQIDALAGQSGMDGLTPVNPLIVQGVAGASRVQTPETGETTSA